MRFGGLVAVDDLSFEARRGDITALIGPNGAGKTTVFNCITGFYKPTEGRISRARLAGGLPHAGAALGTAEPGALPAGAHGRPRIVSARAWRAPSRTSACSRHDGAGEPAGRAAQHADARLRLPFGGLFGLPRLPARRAAAVDKAAYWLEKIGLIDRADDPAGDLPYGDQRRLEIARAMCTEPVLLCLDEPAAGLNPRESEASSTSCCCRSATSTRLASC
jgi:branched-chain amino acid transport system ATP-binding protein